MKSNTNNKKITIWKTTAICAIIALIAVSVLYAFSLAKVNTASSPSASENKTATTKVNYSAADNDKKHKVIIDTDAGSDDAAAILLAANAENLDILGISTLYGNVPLENAANNVLQLVELCDKNIPIYIGTDKPLVKQKKAMLSVHGADGMGDMDLIHPTRTAEKKNAVDFILDTVRENPGEVEIVAIEPLTNIALAFRQDSETMKLVKNIRIMGTTGFGTGNASPVAEFNVFSDAEAYDTVLKSGVPMDRNRS